MCCFVRACAVSAARFADGQPVPATASGHLSSARTNSCSPCCRRAFRRRFPRQATCPYRAQPPPPATIADLLFGDNRQTPEDSRSGAFQKISFVNTYLPRLGGEDGSASTASEYQRVGHSLSHDPAAADHARLRHAMAGRPQGLNIPPQLHEVYAEFRWLPKLGDRFRATSPCSPATTATGKAAAIAPCGSWGTARAFSIGRRIFKSCWAALYSTARTWTAADRGFIWTPDRDVEYKLVFPTPKISWCINKSSALPNGTGQADHPHTDLWLYVAGELGGGAWGDPPQRRRERPDELQRHPRLSRPGNQVAHFDRFARSRSVTSFDATSA